MTTGATGGGQQINDKRADSRQEEEREMHEREIGCRHGARCGGISEGGEGGGGLSHQWTGKIIT